jgi:uncharacterized protein (DUF1778 family)
MTYMAHKLPETGENARESRYIGSRAEPEERRLIDLAAAQEGKSRAAFVLEASKERARQVLAEKLPAALETFATV